MIKLFSPYKKEVLTITFCLILITIFTLYIPLLNKNIMDKGFIEGNQSIIIKFSILILIITIINKLLNIVKEKIRIKMYSSIKLNLIEEAFDHLIKLKIQYFNNKNHAELFNNINFDTERISMIADTNIFFVITQIFSMIGGIIGLFLIDIKLMLIILTFIPIKYVIIKKIAKQQKKNMEKYIKAEQNYSRWFGDTIGGIQEIKIFNLKNYKSQEFKKKQDEILEQKKDMEMLSQYNMSIDTVLIELLIVFIYIIGANKVFRLELSVGSIFAFITYTAHVINPISAILNISYFLNGIYPSAERYYEFMELEKENDYKETVGKIVENDIIFNNVTFKYNPEKEVIKNLSFIIPNKSKTIFVGNNGSGKTTVIKIILKLYNIASGEILLGNTDISCLDSSAYRDLFSVVSQDIYLFNDTIRNNICLYKNVDDETIMDIIISTGLEDFIKENTLNYIVGDRGGMLSGGQKQKIALARALLHNKPILIFDEATSNVDSYSENHINNLFETKLKNKTVIMITHKLKLLDKADQIIFLKDGALVCSGKYNDLLSSNIEFNKMVGFDRL